MRRIRLALVLIPVTAAVAACEEEEFQPPSEEAQVAYADSLYSPALFDTITWASDSLRVAEGNLVYADECRSCHGYLGRGDTDYAAARDLAVPSLVEADWEYAGDPEGVRRRIFVGHTSGMPNWGVGTLTPRQIDAVAYYVLEVLRPELLGEEGGGTAGG